MAVVAASTLQSILTTTPHEFLQPASSLHTSSLTLLKQTLDPLASSLSDLQEQRLQQSRKKRKRGQAHADEEVLRLKKVHVDGFAIEQVWEQARRVIDAARLEAERGYKEAESREAELGSSGDEVEDEELHSGEEGSDLGEEGVDWEYDGDDVDGVDGMTDEEELLDEVEGEGEDEEMADEDEDEDEGDGEEDLEDDGPTEEYVADPNGLNDGFFSIDDFNKQTDFLEQADARGDNDGGASDEEDVDWDANPLAGGAKQSADTAEDEDDDDDDAEKGATFGDADLNAPEGDSGDDDDDFEEGEMDGLGSMSNTNSVRYADFFAPPAKKVGRKNKRGRPNPHNFPIAQNPPSASKDEEENEEDIKRTVSAVHRDLFEDESEGEAEEPEEALDPADPRSRRSTHERRRAALAEEIRKLEAANVAKREWTLSGEARAADRPMNSLLEEDLDFERAGKPVPVITAEISESIEELIKRRILAQDFNDIIRRRPDDLATGKDARRGRFDFELEDSKSKKSLAEMYEEEHLRRTDPNFVDAKDEKTAKEQNEITALWKDISAKLDSLSSWHFKPKPAASSLDIRVDAPAVRLEDARPTAGADAAGASLLAPQEVYKAGEAAEKGEEVVTRGGMPVGREEMSREERKRRRRREKERGKKAIGQDTGAKPEGKKQKEKREMLGDLKKGGVKVIGRKGEIKDVEGQAVREGQAAAGAGSYKL